MLVLTGISLGIFLFLLFFQPFTLDKFDFNNQLLFLFGIGAILFVFTGLIRMGLPLWFQGGPAKNIHAPFPPHVSGFIILILNAVALSFYLRYVGSVPVTFYLIFKVVFICMIPPLILRVYDMLEDLKKQNEWYLEENKRLQAQIQHLRENNSNDNITLISENGREKYDFPVMNVVMIRSADNYVEIIYKEGERLKKQLLRNRLKHIEHQTIQYSSFIRCHRTCIVNLHHTDDLIRYQNNYWLNIKDFPEKVPVSRQYLMRIKESITAKKG